MNQDTPRSGKKGTGNLVGNNGARIKQQATSTSAGDVNSSGRTKGGPGSLVGKNSANMGLQLGVRSFLVSVGQPTIAGHISRKNGRELSLQTLAAQGVPLVQIEGHSTHFGCQNLD
jgi:hypothetical protein